MIRSKSSLIVCSVLLLFAHNCEAGIVLDQGFENPNSTSFWTEFGDANTDASAPGIDPIEGMETLQLIGPGDSTNSGVFQDVAVDGISISVGNQVAVRGILGHTGNDPLAGSNLAFLEVSFVDASNVEFMDSIFISPGIGSTSTTDIYHSNVTPFATVPGNAVAVRVKAVFQQLSVNGNGLSGSAWIDNLDLLVSVPEPSSGVLFAVCLVSTFARRRRRTK